MEDVSCLLHYSTFLVPLFSFSLLLCVASRIVFLCRCWWVMRSYFFDLHSLFLCSSVLFFSPFCLETKGGAKNSSPAKSSFFLDRSFLLWRGVRAVFIRWAAGATLCCVLCHATGGAVPHLLSQYANSLELNMRKGAEPAGSSL